MFRRFLYWYENRSNYKTLIYWQKELGAAQDRVAFCRKALRLYEGRKNDETN